MCNVFTVQLRTEFTGVYEVHNRELYNYDNSAYESNALLYILKTGIAPYEDKW